MDFSWTQDQLDFKSEVIRFAQANLNADIVERDRQGDFSRKDWERCAAFGLQGMAVSSEFNGGRETDFLTAMLAMEGMGYGCRDNGLTFALNAQMWTVELPILHFGDDSQKARYLPSMCSGEWIGAHVITEAEAGSDVFSMTTTAAKQADGYLLNGEKRYVSLATVADVFLVFATLDSELGKWGVTAFLVERDTPGLRVGPTREKMGLRTVPMADLHFENCLIPAANRLGPEGAGVSLSTSSLEWERCCILASQLGAMEKQLEEAIEFTRNRKQFGKSIGKFQSVANRIVDMKLRLETSRLLLYKTAWLKMNGEPAMAEAAMLKLYLGECFVQSSLDAIKLYGGTGYMTETGVERDLRDAVGGTIYAGTSDIQRNIIASLLGL